MNHTFAKKLDMGHHVSEALVAEAIADGFVVLVTERLPLENGHGPRFQGDENLVVIDLQLSKNGRTITVDAKAKTEASYYRIEEEWQHGVDTPILQSYKKSRKVTGIQMLLVFREVGLFPWEGMDTYSINLDNVGDVRKGISKGQELSYINRSDMTKGWLDLANHLCGVPAPCVGPSCENPFCWCSPAHPTKEHQ